MVKYRGDFKFCAKIFGKAGLSICGYILLDKLSGSEVFFSVPRVKHLLSLQKVEGISCVPCAVKFPKIYNGALHFVGNPSLDVFYFEDVPSHCIRQFKEALDSDGNLEISYI